MPIDTARLRASVDLLALVQPETALKRVASSGGGEWAGPCPFCGGRDRLRVQPLARRWLCRGCTGGKWQDAIAYVMRRDRCDFQRACTTLGDTWPRVTGSSPDPPHARAAAVPSSPAWQARAHAIVDTCAAALWTPAGARAREWLKRRGLADGTLREWRIGYHASEGRLAGLYVDRGIVIPCECGDRIAYIQVRRAAGEPKYRKVRGSTAGLYGAGAFRGHQTLVLTEGEFDALLLWQQAGALAAVATFGGAAERPDPALLAHYLLGFPVWLIAFDTDEAGCRGAAWWTGISERARRIVIPRIQPGDKDITDFHRSGGNLSAWLSLHVPCDNGRALL